MTKTESDIKAGYKLNYEVPKLSSYEQVKEENKYKSKQSAIPSEISTTDDSKLPPIKGNNTKVVITGDDVLIEYVTRLIGKIETISESNLNFNHLDSIKKFITHYVWHSEDIAQGTI